MPTLVLPPRLNDDCRAVRTAAVLNGWSVFQSPDWHIPQGLTIEAPVLYSDTLFGDLASSSLGVSLLDPAAGWLTSLPEEYLRRPMRMGNLRDVRETTGGPWFLKPAEDKSFPARVYASASELPGDTELSGDTAVLLSEPVCWLLEVRCFVLDRQVRTLSPYFREGELAEAEGHWPFLDQEEGQALDFAERVLKDSRHSLPASVVLDVGIIKERGWAVVEANPAWASGIYGCDPDQVLPVIQRATLSDSHMNSAEDRRFLRRRAEIER